MLRLALLVLSLLTINFGSAKQNGAAGQRNKTGEVQGSVVDAITNQPVHSAVVILRKSEDSGVGTYTDATGKFAFRDIDAGTYTISAEHDGFVADPKAERRSVTITAGVLNGAGTLKLNRTGAVSGRVTDASGEAISGANIQLQAWKAKKNQPSPVSDASSDDRGNY